MVEAFARLLLITQWADLIEITLFSWACYRISLWLKKDRTKNLLGAFYGYCLLLLGSYFLGLPVLFYALVISSPSIATLFVFVHQQTLARNIITARRTQLASPSASWADSVVRSCLVAMNHQQSVTIVIEHEHELSQLISAPIALSVPMYTDLLLYLLKSSSYNPQGFVWINTQGLLVALNAQWTFNTTTYDAACAHPPIAAWKQDALLVTLKTDALVLHADASKTTFDVIVQGKLLEHISAPHVLSIIKHQISRQRINNAQEVEYGPKAQNNNPPERTY